MFGPRVCLTPSPVVGVMPWGILQSGGRSANNGADLQKGEAMDADLLDTLDDLAQMTDAEVSLVEAVRDQIRDFPESHLQEAWFTMLRLDDDREIADQWQPDTLREYRSCEPHWCDTAACVAGWATIFADDLGLLGPPPYDGTDVGATAKVALGLQGVASYGVDIHTKLFHPELSYDAVLSILDQAAQDRSWRCLLP